ncbi:MAG TPA: hypothetical protein VJG66_04100 [Patescibacteria group bacterium]|nr:hypothetical protein [Patescibacteria group bacterium]
MPFNSAARRARAVKQVRDENGHFIPLKAKVDLSGSGKVLSDLIKTEEDDDAFNLFTLKMGKPWQKLIQILEDIKKKQATTVNLKFTIPLIVLPAVLIAAFTLGRMQTGCGGYFASQVGTLQNITVTRQYRPDNFFLYWFSYLPYLGDYLLKEKALSQPVLVRENNESVIIDNQALVNLNPFNQSKVITFGNYNPCAQTLTLDSEKNISNY